MANPSKPNIESGKLKMVEQILSNLVEDEIKREKEMKEGLIRRDGGRDFKVAVWSREIIELLSRIKD